MKRFTVIHIIIFISLFLSPFLYPQAGGPIAVLEYFDDPYELNIITPAEEIDPADIYFGISLPDGTTIRTNGTYAELRLDPNGSVIKLAPNTVFVVEGLQRGSDDSNNFTLLTGRMRAIAARGTAPAHYRVTTPTAVAGIRGTDFGIESIPGSRERAFVLSGSIDFTNTRTNQTINLTRGMAADALSEVFQAVRLTQLEMRNLLQELAFEALNPEEVPGYEPPADVLPEEPAGEVSAEEEAETGEAPVSAVVDTDDGEPETRIAAPAEEDGIFRALSNLLAFQIGTITIDGNTYSKAVIQPVFSIGKLKLALYLPIIYTDDIFDPDSWYRPRGNDEWSFGTDQSEPADIALDFLSDLLLKIRYIEWGEQRDPFFFKVGNLSNMTLGHGLIMRNFANDSDYPAVRRVGLNLGLDGGRTGFEAVINDLASPEIFGGRFYFRPIKSLPLAFGVSAAGDINPLAGAPEGDDGSGFDYGNIPSDTMLVAGAFDLDLPLIETGPLSMIFFADLAALIPYMDGKFQTDGVYDSSAESFSLSNFRNYGIASGFFGNIFMVDYSLEYRYFRGSFRPAFFDTAYERLRAEYAKNVFQSSESGWKSGTDKTVMGIFGSAGFTLFNMIGIEAAYMWPWSPGSGFQGDDDEVHLTLSVFPDVIPVIGIHGSVSYSRRSFIPTLIGDNDLTLFDANSTLSGELVYPLTHNLEIAGVFGTSLSYKPDGTLNYSPSGKPKVIPHISIETRVSF